MLLLAFIVTGLSYSVIVPVFEAPDENAHFAYARYMAQTGSLPVQDPANPGPWSQEGSQPPLYYLLAALVIRGVDTSEVAALQWKNPQNVMGHPAEPGNKNRFIHTDRERFPYQGAVLAVHLARLVSVLMGAGTVWLTYLIARQVFAPSGEGPSEPALALASAAFVAFLPQFLFISAAVNNDSAVTLFSTASLYCLLRLTSSLGPQVAGDRAQWAWALALGICLGLALLSKLSALLLVPFLALTLAVEAWHKRLGHRFLVAVLAALGVAALVAGWWFLRNLRLYGDPVAANVMMEIAGRRAFKLERFLGGAWEELRGLRWSFWALFGWFSLPISRPVYLVLDVLVLAAALGLVMRKLRPTTNRGTDFVAWRWPISLLLLWLLMVLGGLVWWAAFAKGAQGRLLFPAIAPIAVLLVAGWWPWLPRRTAGTMPVLVGLPMLAFALGCLLGVIRPAYARPPLINPDQIPREVARPEATFGGVVRLLGVTVTPADVAPGQTVNLTFYWQALAPVAEDALLNIRLFGHDPSPMHTARDFSASPALALLVNEDTYPGWGTFPPVLWPVGPVVVDRYRFNLPADADVPALVRVDVGFVDRVTGQRWPVTDGRGQPTPAPTFVTSFRLRRPDKVRTAQQPLARLDDGIVLLGYEVVPAVVHAGGSVRMTLQWAAEAVPAADYTVFAHLVDASGRLVAQADGPPRGGDYPTRVWLPGDRVPDQRVIQVPSDAPPGEYHLLVGMYRLETGQRLPAYDTDGRHWPDDAVRLPVSIRMEP